jgi:twitching motility two-component system response regulator PilG
MASRWRPLPKSSVGKCAPHRSRDRLEVASLFAAWAKKGLVSLQTPPDLLQPQRRTSITLLAVDDSVVMQEILRQYLSQ